MIVYWVTLCNVFDVPRQLSHHHFIIPFSFRVFMHFLIHCFDSFSYIFWPPLPLLLLLLLSLTTIWSTSTKPVYVNCCIDASFSDRGVLEGDRISPSKSDRQALNKNVVSLVSTVSWRYACRSLVCSLWPCHAIRTPSSTVILVQYLTNIQPIWNIAHILAKI